MDRAPLTVPGALVVLVAAGLPSPGAAQGGELRAEAGAFRAYPPSGSAAEVASYAVAGLRADLWWGDGSGAWAEAFGGLDSGDDGGDWISGLAGVRRTVSPGGPLEGALDFQVHAFAVGEPLVYRAVTVSASGEVEASLAGDLSGAVVAGGGSGGSTLELLQDGRSRRAAADLWRYGGGPELRFRGATATAVLGARVLESAGGTYRRLGLRGGGTAAGIEWSASVGLWDTPLGRETVGGVAVSVPVGGDVELRMVGGRTEPDPLILSEPGTQAGGVLSLQIRELGPGTGPRLVELERPPAGGEGPILARFRLRRPGAGKVEILGDFTRWEPVVMEGTPQGWTLELELPPGTYHYGFLVDGRWVVPEEATGRIADEWGRENATLVIPRPDDGPGASAGGR